MRFLFLLLAVVLAASCGSPDAVPSIDGSTVVAPTDEQSLPGSASDDSSDPALAETRWILSRTVRDIDGLPYVVVYHSADEVDGLAVGADVVFFARCVGDRTEVEFAYPVPLGDDVYNDGDVRTKRVLFRLIPSDPAATVWPVAPNGTSLLVAQPVRFLRQLVLSDRLYVQTTSVQGAVLFAAYDISPLTFQRLRVAADVCDWQSGRVHGRIAVRAGCAQPSAPAARERSLDVPDDAHS